MLLFGSQQKGIPMPWKEWSEHQTKYIHQLSTPYSIWRTFFRFENGWREPKLSHKVKGPKRGPKSQKRFSTCTLTINALTNKNDVGSQAFQLLKFQSEDCLRSSSSARLAASHHYKARDGKGWIPLVWLLGYNESLSDSMGSCMFDWYVWTMTKQSLSSTIEVLILSWCVSTHFVIVWGHTLGEYSRVNKLFAWQIGCHTFKT